MSPTRTFTVIRSTNHPPPEAGASISCFRDVSRHETAADLVKAENRLVGGLDVSAKDMSMRRRSTCWACLPT